MHTMRPCPGFLQENESKSGANKTSQQEGGTTTEDEAIIAAAFSYVTYLDVKPTCRVEVGNEMNWIAWY